MYCSIGERIMIMRKRNGLSKKELAEMVGVTYTTINNYEAGKTLPSCKHIVKLSLALNISIDELIHLADASAEPSGLEELLNQLKVLSTDIIIK